MVRVGALAMAVLLLLVPASGHPALARRLRELRPGHGVKYQQVSITTVKNYAYKTSVNVILNQSTLRRSSRNLKSFKRNLEVPRKNDYMNCQQTNMLKRVIPSRRKLYLIARRCTHISRRHLKTNKHIQGGQSRKMWNTILNNRFQLKMKCHSIVNVRIKPDTKRIEESHICVENKYIETVSSLSCLALQANFILDAVLKCQEVFENILKLKLNQVRMLKQHINTGMLQMKKYKQYNDQISDHSKEYSKENRNAFDKINYGMFTDRLKEVISEKEGQYMDFGNYVLSCQSFQWTTSFPNREMMKVWKQKMLTKKNMNENHRCLFVHACTYQRNSDVQKMFSTHNMSNIQGNDIFTFRRQMYRNKKLIGKWKKVQMQPSVIHPAFPTIKIAIEVYCGKFNSEVNPAKPSVLMMNTLQYLIHSSQRGKKYSNVTQERYRIKSLKAHMVRKHLDTEDIFLCKHISNSPLVVKRTKRSAQGGSVPVPVDVLKRLTSALIAVATIFGIAFLALALTGCYLFDKRRELGRFFDIKLKNRKPKKHTKPVENQSSTPISVSQRFHLAQSQGSRRNQTALASVTAAEAYSIKESDFIIVKQIYDNSDSEDSSGMSHDHHGLTVKSRAYVFSSRSNESIRSFCGDVGDLSSSLPSSADEIKTKNSFTNLPNSIVKGKESVPQPESSHDNQEQCTSGDLLLQLKRTKDSPELSFSDEITIENQVSNPSATTPKEKEMFPVIPQPDYLCGNQEQCTTSSDTEPQLKKTTDSSQPYLLAEITVEDQVSNMPTTIPKEEELVPVVTQPGCHNYKQ
nr:PREDICTED: uncharacterized protein LOC103278698 isoform X1 [Anolis carolinensis]|eukprot:XP_008107776.1 PREDICTED: uncharacterized protein LOC103278698 isoform X1 [Anolis carolinensis]